MITLLENVRSGEGFPSIRWEQDPPTGQSAYGVQQSITLKIAIVIMIFVFTAVYASGGDVWSAVLAALVVAGMGLAGDRMFKGGITIGGVHVPGPPDRSPQEARAEELARATAIMGKEYCHAFVAPQGEKKELYFWLFRGEKPDRMACIGGAPLADIQAFELGTSEEWFADVAQAAARRHEQIANSLVIVAPTLGHGVLPVAETGGAKAGIAALHGVLTKAFVMEAREMQERWKAKLEEEQRARELEQREKERPEGGGQR